MTAVVTEVPLCSPPDRNPRRPELETPPGAVDCHTHIFHSRYPLSPARGYTPVDSTLAEMLHMHRQLGVARVVFVQPSVYGIDNSAILDALAQVPDRGRAVVALDLDTSDDEIARLDDIGVRGIRLNLADKGGMPIPVDEIDTLAQRIRDLGWHLEFLFVPNDLADLAIRLRSLPVPVAIGHFGYVEAAHGIDYPPFRILLDLVAEGNTWIKLSAPYRLGVGDLPPWNEVVPLAQTLIATNPARMLWATDWPHPNKYGAVPNDADLIDQLARWAPDPELQRQILVDNPVGFYRF